MPEILSVGPHLGDYETRAAQRPVPRATLDQRIPIGVIAESATGFSGRPGIVGARPDGSAWAPRFVLGETRLHGSTRVVFDLVDEVAALGLRLDLEVSDVLTVRARLDNRGTDPFMVQRLAISIPLPAHAEELQSFTGRWCREFQPVRGSFDGTTLVENRTGRTSHARLPALFAGTGGFTEESGEVWGAQLAWSGNFSVAAECLADGRRHLQLGEHLSPFEVELDATGVYETPAVVVAWSDRGLSLASDAFHREARRRSPSTGPRPVMLNTWEAVYFDHDLDTLRRLATVAAEVGVERFVLDDGWFGGRRNDGAGLGDWWVSETAWPTGLGPIVDHVRGHGMQFGLWVEPEMVNPDSDLYRSHPDWTLTTDGYEPVLGRNQLVLDFGREEVQDFLFAAIDALLDEYDIAYLKWDMNRDIVQGSRAGRAGVHGHVLGVYGVMDRLRAQHPGLEIESCASGGGRADLGILERTDRIWTSDCNDALERQLIQRGFGMLFPPEVMGAHVGPERAHTTGRRQDLGFRCATALFGHLGIEWNLLEATPDERIRLAEAVALHKRLRPLLHHGRVVRGDHPDPSVLVHGVVSDDQAHAVFASVQLQPSAFAAPAPMRLPGLEDDATYTVSTIETLGSAKEFGVLRPGWLDAPVVVSGAQLGRRGLEIPVLHPESVVLIELRRQNR